MLIDRFLPEYDWNEIHSTEIAASPAAVLDALRRVTAAEIRLLRVMFVVRSLPGRLLGRPAPPRGSGPVMDGILRSGFVLLADGGHELVVGTIGRFWQARPTHAAFEDGDAFLAFREPGYAKAVMNFAVSDLGAGRARLSTETRIIGTDARARRRFRAYWLFVRPGSGLIRIMWLRAVKSRAESGKS